MTRTPPLPARFGPQHLRMAVNDKMAGQSTIVGVVGPIRMPPRDALVAALLKIAELGPGARAGLRFDRPGSGWVYDPATLAAWCDSLITVVDSLVGDDAVTAAVRYGGSIDDSRPLRFLIAGDYLIQLYEHSLGDSTLLLGLLGTVVSVAGGDPLPGWLSVPSAAHPITAALWHTFGRHPRQVSALLAARSEDAPPPRAAAPRQRAWTPSPAIAYVAIPALSMRTIRDWCRRAGNGPTTTAVMLVLLRRALRQEGLPAAATCTVVYDVRRYLPDGLSTVQNLITGIPLSVADPDDPWQVAAGIRGTVESGRPLAALAAGAAKRMVRPAARAAPTSVSTEPSAELVLSNMGVSRVLQRLPWIDPGGDRHAVFGVQPVGPAQFSVLMLLIDGVAHLTASFHDNVLDPAAVDRALRLVAARPESLLGEALAR
jgi:hypothetical protein